MQTVAVTPSSDRANSFGALRLILASMVIFAHVPELFDGNRSREPITFIFNNGQTAGSLAVDGFFLISGFLIAGSWLSSPSTYLIKRILRIYPAFLVCSALIVLIVGPLGGGAYPSGVQWLRMLYRMATLQAPISDGAFAQLHIPAVNVSMWTISYEFRCYLLTAALGLLGLLNRPRVIFGLAAVLLGLSLLSWPELEVHLAGLMGNPQPTFRLLGVFLVGIAYRLRPPPLNGSLALGACLLLVPLLFVDLLAEVAFVILGGYVLFWIALRSTWPPLRRLNATDDISYGVYLWAWPISALLLSFFPRMDLLVLLPTTLAASLLCGAVSWRLVEKPVMQRRGKFFRPKLALQKEGSGLSP
jgi:peptidoglycan/LPS O-acetylase OafA/YrhL